MKRQKEEIEITADMVAAGRNSLLRFELGKSTQGEAVVEIFRAMWAAKIDTVDVAYTPQLAEIVQRKGWV